MSQIKYKLNNWAIVTDCSNPFQAPELRRQALMGIVEGHPKRDDGKTIVTSFIKGTFEDRVVTASGSLIELGEPKADYASLFPNAKQRLFDSAPRLTLLPSGSIR